MTQIIISLEKSNNCNNNDINNLQYHDNLSTKIDSYKNIDLQINLLMNNYLGTGHLFSLFKLRTSVLKKKIKYGWIIEIVQGKVKDTAKYSSFTFR